MTKQSLKQPNNENVAIRVINRLLNFFTRLLSTAPNGWDVLILIGLVVLATFNPFYLNRPVNFLELGLYLPGINALLHGLTPFRDFFHLRGPLEIAIPALLMKVFGTHLSVLTLYFYVSNVACLILLVLIAKELVASRYMLYMMVPVIITRTFPRVVYMIWGGMRFCLGLLILWLLIRGFKYKKNRLFFGIGTLTVISFLVSIDVGVYSFLAGMAAFAVGYVLKVYDRRWLIKVFLHYVKGLLLVALPFLVYAITQGLWQPYLDAMSGVVIDKQSVINQHAVSIYPHNLAEMLAAMFNPRSINFKHFTPAYLYVFLALYIGWRLKKGVIGAREHFLIFLGVYGVCIYAGSLRDIWASQLEMALMPQKLLYFALIEIAVLWAWGKVKDHIQWRYVVQVAIVVLFLSSVIYSIGRLNHRFFSFRYVSKMLAHKNVELLKYFSPEPYRKVTVERLKGVEVPTGQADDLEATVNFIDQHTQVQDKILFYPEGGLYNYIADRPFVGRFPVCSFAWIKERWYQEFKADFLKLEAKYVFVTKRMPDEWFAVYFDHPSNKSHFEETNRLIEEHYRRVGETPLSWIYERR